MGLHVFGFRELVGAWGMEGCRGLNVVACSIDAAFNSDMAADSSVFSLPPPEKSRIK